MAALSSALRGDRLLSARQWIVGYAATWLLPVPLGLIMLVLPMLVIWPYEALGRVPPFENGLKLVFGLGWIVVFAPMLSWIGLLLSAPFVWLVLRFGFGGWANFAVAGAAVGAMSAAILDGMHVLFPALTGAVSALFFRMILSWLHPQVFAVEKISE